MDDPDDTDQQKWKPKKKANYGNRVLNVLLVFEDNVSTQCFSTTIVSC